MASNICDSDLLDNPISGPYSVHLLHLQGEYTDGIRRVLHRKLELDGKPRALWRGWPSIFPSWAQKQFSLEYT